MRIGTVIFFMKTVYLNRQFKMNLVDCLEIISDDYLVRIKFFFQFFSYM